MRTLIVFVMLMLTTPAMAADSIRDTHSPNIYVYKDVDSLIEGVRITLSWKEGMSKDDWRLLMKPLLACIPPNDTPVVRLKPPIFRAVAGSFGETPMAALPVRLIFALVGRPP